MTLLYSYLAFGVVIGFIVGWASFEPDYDAFVREEFDEEPPDTTEKIIMTVGAVVLWPLYLWWAFR